MIRLIYVARLLVWITIIFFVLWLVVKNIVPFGKLSIHHQLNNPSSRVTDFRPGERLIPWQKSGERVYHTLKGSPIFFHVLTPRPFQTADFTIEYRLATTSTVMFGDQTGQELYEFNYVPMTVIPDGEWHRTTISIDLGRMYYQQSTHRYQFSFVTDALIDIAGFDVVFRKSPLSIEKLRRQILW